MGGTYLFFIFSENQHYIVRPQICFEAGKEYFVTLDFPHYQVPDDTPEANILIDSVSRIIAIVL